MVFIKCTELSAYGDRGYRYLLRFQAYNGTTYHATNVPAKICPECGKITIYEIIEERIVQYATQRNVKNIDYAECENEEASASQLIL